ncbi:MAG: hypothetical protein WDO16_26360 [Bacteroidota bacterium]
MGRFFLSLFFITTLLSSCEVTVKKNDDKEKNTDSKIRNGIVVTSKGIKVEQAFLLFEDGTLVPDDNLIRVNQKVILRLIVSGWKEKEGKVFVSGGEMVETSEGDVLFGDKNLFKDFSDGITSRDAEYISMNVVISGVTKLFDYYKVSFQVKDDLATDNKLEGHYKLYLK